MLGGWVKNKKLSDQKDRDISGNIKLSDLSDLYTKFCFLDESGSLSRKKEKYFTIGILKMSMPYYLQSKILYQRNIKNFHDELKFNKISLHNIDFAKFVIDSIFDTRSLDFFSYTTHKDSEYFKRNFLKDPWQAYEKITMKILDTALIPKDILILIADYISTPKEIKFESNVKNRFNKSKERLAVAGVVRFDSKSNDLLQITDLMIGCISYDLKYKSGEVQGSKYKLELTQYFKDKLGVKDFCNGFKNHNFNIFVERINEEKDENP